MKLKNGTEEQWFMDTYTAHRNDAFIEVGCVDYRFVKIFEEDYGHVPYNAKVIAIQQTDKERKVKYDDRSITHFTLSHIKELSTLQWNELENEGSESKEEEEEVPFSKAPSPKKDASNGKFFNPFFTQCAISAPFAVFSILALAPLGLARRGGSVTSLRALERRFAPRVGASRAT